MNKIDNDCKKLLKHFPKKVSKELEDYSNEIFKFSKYIFTYRIKKQQYGYCTHCKKDFKTNGFKHKSKERCPECNSPCTVQASGLSRTQMIDKAYFVYYEKSVVDPNVIVARGIYATRDYSGEFREVSTNFYTEVYYVFDMKNGSVMFEKMGYYWDNNTKFRQSKSIHCKFSNYYFDTPIGYSRESIENAVKDTPFGWSGWENYDYEDMVKFFDLYTKYPCIEYLTKLGFVNLVKAKLYGDRTYSAINWKGKNLFKILKLTKKDLNEIKSKNIDLTFLCLKIFQLSKKDRSNFSIDESNQLALFYEYYFNDLEKILKYGTFRKVDNYIRKQYEKNKKHFYSIGQVIVSYKDYINDCIKLEMNLDDKTVFFPKNLYTAHQNTIKQVKIQGDEIWNKKILKRLNSLTKYYFEYKGLVIRPAKSSNELIEEGKALNHCVGTYAEKYAEGKTDLLLIRKLSELDKPFFTMEVRKNIVVQVRGKRNCSPDAEIEDLIKAFENEILNTNKNKSKSISA